MSGFIMIPSDDLVVYIQELALKLRISKSEDNVKEQAVGLTASSPVDGKLEPGCVQVKLEHLLFGHFRADRSGGQKGTASQILFSQSPMSGEIFELV